MGNCCRRRHTIGPISILLLGYEQCGKTEIGHALSRHTRIDFTSTKGVRMFNLSVKDHAIKLVEIGGSDSVRGIWPHYYNEAYGIIYVIDCALHAPFERMRDVLHKTMKHKHIRGKPLLIIGNKQDINDSIDVVDITYFFQIDEMCNKLGSPCLIITSGENSRSELSYGIEWIVRHVLNNYKTIQNRMRFNCLPLTPIKRFNRLRTSFSQKVARTTSATRIRSAPSSFTLRSSPRIGSSRLKPIPLTQLPVETSLFRLNPIILQHE